MKEFTSRLMPWAFLRPSTAHLGSGHQVILQRGWVIQILKQASMPALSGLSSFRTFFCTQCAMDLKVTVTCAVTYAVTSGLPFPPVPSPFSATNQILRELFIPLSQNKHTLGTWQIPSHNFNGYNMKPLITWRTSVIKGKYSQQGEPMQGFLVFLTIFIRTGFSGFLKRSVHSLALKALLQSYR